RELLVGVEGFGVEHLKLGGAGGGVRHAVAVELGDLGADGDGDLGGVEGEVVDVDLLLGGGGLSVRVRLCRARLAGTCDEQGDQQGGSVPVQGIPWMLSRDQESPSVSE